MEHANGCRLLCFVASLLMPWQQAATAASRPNAVVVDVVAAYPGASAEDVERQIVIPLEVLLAGIPSLERTLSQSVPGLAWVRLEFRPGADRQRIRQEAINRLASAQSLPAGVVPQLHPATAADQLMRYVLRGPRDPGGNDVYPSSDLRELCEWIVARQFRRVPGVADVLHTGGTLKRYEVHLDPDRLRRYGITLEQLRKALAESNAAAGGDYVRQGGVGLTVRGEHLLGGGLDPVQKALGLKDPREAAAMLRAEEQRRVREIRSLRVATVNRVPVHVEDVVEGGPLARDERESRQGVLVGHPPRAVPVGRSRAGQPDENDLVQGIILLRPGADRQRTLEALHHRIQQLNENIGTLLPGVRVEPCYERGSDAGVLWIRGALPVDLSLERAVLEVQRVRALLLRHPEVCEVVTQIGPDNAGTDAAGLNPVQALVRLRPTTGKDRPHTRKELADLLRGELNRDFGDMAWQITDDLRDDLQAAFTAAPSEGMLKIFGPDLGRLERLAGRARQALESVDGVSRVQAAPILGRPNLRFDIDRDKCKRWGISVNDVNTVLQGALGGTRAGQMVEGEKTFEIALFWPGWRRGNELAILDIPVDLAGDKGGVVDAPRLRLRELVSPQDAEGSPTHRRAAVIYREDGCRFIPLHFRLPDRDAAATLALARQKVAPLWKAPYRALWDSGR